MRSSDSGEWVEGDEEREVCFYEVISIDRHFPHSPLFIGTFLPANMFCD